MTPKKKTLSQRENSNKEKKNNNNSLRKRDPAHSEKKVTEVDVRTVPLFEFNKK